MALTSSQAGHALRKETRPLAGPLDRSASVPLGVRAVAWLEFLAGSAATGLVLADMLAGGAGRSLFPLLFSVGLVVGGMGLRQGEFRAWWVSCAILYVAVLSAMSAVIAGLLSTGPVSWTGPLLSLAVPLGVLVFLNRRETLSACRRKAPQAAAFWLRASSAGAACVLTLLWKAALLWLR